MTFDSFITKYNGKTVDVDNAFGGQCVDLYRLYVKEVLGFAQSPPVKGAKDIWDTYLSGYFIRYSNTPLGVPQKGDIIIWGKSYGPYGHVGIYYSGNVLNFKSFDQNDPVGSRCHIQSHSYRGVLGWLRPRNFNLTDDEKVNAIMVLRDQPGSNTEKLKKIESIIHA